MWDIFFVLSDAVLCKKWKYLRDQFSVEFGKIKPPRSGDPGGESYEPKWPHYRSLLFLKDTVKPRASSSNLKPGKSARMQFNPIPSNDKTVDSVQRGDSGDHDDRGDSVAFNENGNEDLRFAQYGTHDENQDDGEVNIQERSLLQDNPRKRKRNGVNAKYNETIIAIEKQTAKFLEEAVKNRQPENEDLLFFRSLLPHVNNIPANMKLRFRNHIQQVVDEFAYPSSSSLFQPCPFSMSSSLSPPPPPSASSTFNSLSSEGVASPPAVPEEAYQNY